MLDSTLYLSPTLELLARKLLEQLDAESAGQDPFVPVTIVVPGGDVRTWLQLYLAEKCGVAINIRVQYLESVLWTILCDISAATPPAPVARLEHESYRLLVLAILMEQTPDLDTLHAFTGAKDIFSRQYCRKVWDIADRLARLVRDYEYHRQDEYIQHWIKGELVFKGADADTAAMERCQSALFQRIIDPITGVRARASSGLGKTFKTLPQLGMETVEGTLRPPDEWPAYIRQRPIHLFGLSQISEHHIFLLRWLSKHIAFNVYHVNPLASCVSSAGLCARTKSDACAGTEARTTDALLNKWAAAGRASLQRMSRLIDNGSLQKPFKMEVLPAETRDNKTVLGCVQNNLLAPKSAQAHSLAQDKSLQVVACPGIFREVETVYQSILHNLHTDSTLRQNEIAVLVTDMNLYRPVIQTVFERDCDVNPDIRIRPRSPISYTLADCPAAELSVYGQALLAMIDAALEGFPRSRVMDILTNPCVLARLNADPEQAGVWMNWAERLAVFHSWDQRDKRESGFGDSALYSWRLGLQRLRLGGIMEAPDSDSHEPVPQFKQVVPYSDMESSDPRQLDIFCRAVEDLLPALADFRRVPATGEVWARRIRFLMETFLDIPGERGEEGGVRTSLISSLELLQTFDAAADGKQPLSMPLIREFLAAQLDTISMPVTGGRFGGVTIAPLATARPLPYRVVYILGLGEGLYPTPDSVTPFDLREKERQRLPGDIKPSEVQRQQFLEFLGATSDKLYLLYCCRDIQKDQKLYAGSLIHKLKAHVSEQVLRKDEPEFSETRIPLTAYDPKYLDAGLSACSKQDAIVTYLPSHRVLALQQVAEQTGQIFGEDGAVSEFLSQASRTRRIKVAPPAVDEAGMVARVTIRDLAMFLKNPHKESLRKHLRLRDQTEREACDDEPVSSGKYVAGNILEGALRRFVMEEAGGRKPDARECVKSVEQAYRNRVLQGASPDGAFGGVELLRLREAARERLLGARGAVQPLAQRHAPGDFCGPVQIGGAGPLTGAGAMFPALCLNVSPGGRPATAHLTGSHDLIWSTSSGIDEAVILHGKTRDNVPDKKLTQNLFEPVLFYLALLAGTAESANGESSCKWVKERPLRLTIALEDGMSEYTYSEIAREEAQNYLAQLVTDYLTPDVIDVLPFKVISGIEAELRAPYESYSAKNPAPPDAISSYPQKLQDAIDGAFDGNDAPRLEPVDLLELQPPADAFDKVQRRYEILDRGPRANRAAANDASPAAAPPPAAVPAPGKKSSKRKKD